MSTRALIAAAASTALVVACGSAAMQARPQTSPSAVQTMPNASPEHQQIEDLERQIADEHAKLPQRSTTSMGVGSNPTCVRNASAVCTQTCELSDSICTNSAKICELADKLSGDDWAATKCKDNKATCETAKTQCCECTP
ncbi:MAG: hypothetical protein ABI591_28855 [Kofleriaceae bacterium]